MNAFLGGNVGILSESRSLPTSYRNFVSEIQYMPVDHFSHLPR